MNKAELRQYCIRKRREMDLSLKTEKDKIIEETLYDVIAESGAKNVLIYLSTNEEIRTLGVAEKLICDGCKVYSPKCVADGIMTFYRVNTLDELTNGKYNIKEPISMEKPDYQKETICVVPALSVDRQGNRIGYGKGYYDRFLKEFKGVSVALCYNSFFMEEIPKESTDISVDMVITEKQKYIVI